MAGEDGRTKTEEETMSEPLMKLYQTEWCPYCRRVRMKLTELGITYVAVNVPRNKSSRTDLLAVSGQLGIPTLVEPGRGDRR